MKYMVSISALEYQAYKMGLLIFEENRYFYATLNRKDYRKNEALDEAIAIIRPGNGPSLLDLIFKNHLFPLNDILNNYCIDRSFLESLFGIENQFLSQYSEESNREYFNNSNVVSLFTKES